MSVLLQQFAFLFRRYPVALTSSILFVLLGIGDYFLWQRREGLAGTYDRTRQEGEAMFSALNGHTRILAQLATVNEALTYIDGNLPAETDLAGNLDYFYQIEKITKIRLAGLSQLSSQPGGPDAPFRAIPFSLRLAGPYNQIMAFLHALETGPRLIRVKNYRFVQTDPGAVDGLSLDLTVEMLGRP